MRTGAINLPLHGGKAPYRLFSRMKKLSREIMSLIVSEYLRFYIKQSEIVKLEEQKK